MGSAPWIFFAMRLMSAKASFLQAGEAEHDKQSRIDWPIWHRRGRAASAVQDLARAEGCLRICMCVLRLLDVLVLHAAAWVNLGDSCRV
jgi:hypothetical protein